MSFYALANLWLLLLIPPVVLLYFLKLKRPQLRVPSLALWRQVMEDKRVNSPFQRFKRNLLLLLQLLLLLLLILAAAQPFLHSAEASRGQRLPVLIDASASMAALDAPGGVSRLDDAKRRVRELIDNLLPDQQLCLISFTDAARKRTGFTNNKRVLREALDAIQVEDVPGALDDALRMTQALGQSAAFDRVLLLSDGNFPMRADFELSFQLDYQKLDAGGANVGVTALNAVRVDDANWDVFVRLSASPNAKGAVTGTLSVIKDGQPHGRDNFALDPGESQRLVFRLAVDGDASLEVAVEPDDFDSLASDNRAFLDLPAGRAVQVYAAPGLTPFRHALASMPGLAVYSDKQPIAEPPVDGPADASADDRPQAAAEPDADTESEPGTDQADAPTDAPAAAPPDARAYDLIIIDSPADLSRKSGTILTVGFIPPAAHSLLTMEEQGTEVVDWRRLSPLLEHVELADLVLLERSQYAPGAGAADLENLGFEVIIHGVTGPLLLRRETTDQLAYHLLFRPQRSTLPYRVGFPIMTSNLIDIARRRAGLGDAQAVQTGVLPAMALTPNTDYDVSSPDQTTAAFTSNPQGELVGVAAPRVGRYRVSRSGQTLQQIGAALLSTDESSLTARERIAFNELSVEAAAPRSDTDQPLWRWLAAGAMAMLLLEWWYFQRKPGGFAS